MRRRAAGRGTSETGGAGRFRRSRRAIAASSASRARFRSAARARNSCLRASVLLALSSRSALRPDLFADARALANAVCVSCFTYAAFAARAFLSADARAADAAEAALPLARADADGERAQGMGEGPQPSGHGRPAGLHGGAGSQRERHAWPAEPAICRVAHGLANRVDRVTALGNGQVPRVAAAAWLLLTHNRY